jgi:hypothetical protein
MLHETPIIPFSVTDFKGGGGFGELLRGNPLTSSFDPISISNAGPISAESRFKNVY